MSGLIKITFKNYDKIINEKKWEATVILFFLSYTFNKFIGNDSSVRCLG